MGQARVTQRSAADEQAERVVRALEETDRTGRAPASIRDEPGRFLRDLYEVWHRQGGKEGGRPRNSIRKMRDQWLVGRQAVPSLHPKLMGRIKVTRADARALIDLFLTRWRYAGSNVPPHSATTQDGYVAFAAADLKRLRDLVLAGLIKTTGRAATLQLPLQSDNGALVEETRQRWVDIEKVVNECDALITLSRHKIAVGPSPWQTIGNIWHMLNHLYEYDQARGFPERMLIWVIDLGSREVEQPNAFEEFYNAGLLALQLASFANFDTNRKDNPPGRPTLLPSLTITESGRRDELWRWIAERTVIVVQNLRLEEIKVFHGEEEERIRSLRLKDVGVTAEHLLPSTTPRAWGRELRRLYGKEISASDATFTVFIHEQSGDADDQHRTIRYFAHTPLRRGHNTRPTLQMTADWVTRSQELMAPDNNYNHAFRLVFWASRYRLSWVDEKTESLSWEALAYLRKIGFRVLDLPSFLKIFSAEN